MANAKKCDRCGVLFEERQLSAIEEAVCSIAQAASVFTGDGIKTPCIANADLCADCKKSLKKWWKDGAKNGK